MELPKIRVADFEGPFDLLLHLIKKNKMDIYNVEIYKITSQYLEYLDEMKEMDLDITSEFIVVAATLIEIKSKNLLPKPKIVEEDEEDVEKNLLEKLILYRKIKGATEFFREKYISSGDIYTKKPEVIEEIKGPLNNEDLFKSLTLLDLFNILNDLLDNYVNKQNKGNVIQRKIYVDKYKIEDKYDYILDIISNRRITEFKKIVEDSECKMEEVVTFLALLELIKQRKVKVTQLSSFSDILIEMRNEDE
ncbi:MAG: segregation/condensation protein A [Clostridium sp.]